MSGAREQCIHELTVMVPESGRGGGVRRPRGISVAGGAVVLIPQEFGCGNGGGGGVAGEGGEFGEDILP